MSENGPREDLAKHVSAKLLGRFKWKTHSGPTDQEFPCINESKHKPDGKKTAHTHPVDVVFHYKDPYLNKTIYLNTDLKSYSKASLTPQMIETALNSLAKTIECARNSQDWKRKYSVAVGASEVRGLLFVYNHDNEYSHNFYDYFNPPKPAKGKRREPSVNLDRISIAENQQIHIIEPKTIRYMMTVVGDMNELIAERKFPDDDYGFYYPELTYHKVLTSDDNLPATVECLTSAYMIVKHGATYTFSESDGVIKKVEAFPPGFIVYYNRDGSTDLEFYYLLDTLANYQILNAKNTIRIRVASVDRHDSIRSNFSRAIEKYAYQWGYDDKIREKLMSIELYVVPIRTEKYSSEERSWEVR